MFKIKNTEENPDTQVYENSYIKNKYLKAKEKKENKLKVTTKSLKRTLKPIFKKENITKFIIIISSLALLATSVLPFIIQ